MFYRESGPVDGPVLLLLHGFPTSSFQYRNLIPLLADHYRIIAPDLPGFGFTEVSPERRYHYTFDHLAQTVEAFTEVLNVKQYTLYVFDYGAPTGFRLAMAHPERITAIVSQNGNAYAEGLGDAWAPIQRYWREPSSHNREILRQALDPAGLRLQYTDGVPHPEWIDPVGYTLDAAIARAGSEVIVAARTPAKGTDAVKRIRKEIPSAQVRFEPLDLASLTSVSAFATTVGSEQKIDLLVNNAGVMRVPTRELTEDGFERQFGTNFVGPFALTMLLIPALLRSDAPRVTTISSGAANIGLKQINFDDLHGDKSYGPWKAYCQSKLTDLMFAIELGHRSRAARMPLVSNAAHPGWRGQICRPPAQVGR